jgi:septum formation protein
MGSTLREDSIGGVRLILASASPRRAELLRAAGFEFDVMPADVDESVLPGESPEPHVRRLAEAKARALVARAGRRPVLGADTVVVVDGEILGKPVNDDDARRMLFMLSGRRHQVVTGVCVMEASTESVTGVAVTTVELSPLTAPEIDWYVRSGEPMNKAGAYAIQGLASRFITRIEGSYSNVVGLPIALVYRLCIDAGLLIS